MYEVQHYGNALRDHVTLARHATLGEAVAGVGRILRPFNGEKPHTGERGPDTYRIVETNKNGKPVALYSHEGALTELLTKKKQATKQLVVA